MTIRLEEPTSDELAALEELYRKTKSVRIRTRVQMVLLALEQQMNAEAIARVVRMEVQAVRRWLKRYQAEGIDGLYDRPQPGSPGKVTMAYQQQLEAAVRQRPRALGLPYSLWTLQRLADYLAEETGIRVSHETVRLHLRAADIVLSRPQHKISSPDPEYILKKRRSKRHETT